MAGENNIHLLLPVRSNVKNEWSYVCTPTLSLLCMHFHSFFTMYVLLLFLHYVCTSTLSSLCMYFHSIFTMYVLPLYLHYVCTPTLSSLCMYSHSIFSARKETILLTLPCRLVNSYRRFEVYIYICLHGVNKLYFYIYFTATELQT
jgi:hypothetical protein